MLKKILWSYLLLIMMLSLSGCKEDKAPTMATDETIVSDNVQINDEASVVDEGESTNVGDQLPEFIGSGNTSSNILNDGIAAEYEGYVYHSDKMMAGSVWRTSMDDNESELIVKGVYHSINVNNGYLFLAGYEDDGEELFSGKEGMFLMSIQDKELRLIKEGDFDFMTLYNNWIYYVDVYNDGMYRIRPDGSEDTLLVEGAYGAFAIANDQIYIQTDVIDSNEYIYTLPLDGGTPKKLIEDTIWGGNFSIGGGYIYYETSDDSSSGFRVDLDGTNKVSFFEEYPTYINISDDTIYYVSIGSFEDRSDKGIYRMNIDGSNDLIIYAGDPIFSPNVTGDLVIWHTNDDQRRLTRMNVDGGEATYITQLAE